MSDPEFEPERAPEPVALAEGDLPEPQAPELQSPGDLPRASSGEPEAPRLRLGRWIAATALGLMIAGLLVIFGWWRSTPAKPTDVLSRASTPHTEPTEDVEQLAFESQDEVAPSASDEPAPVAGKSIVDRDWIQRLDGRWTLDLGNRAIAVEFGSFPIRRSQSGGDSILEVFSSVGLGLPPFYTVLRRAGGGSFLAFQDESGQYKGLLDDLESHGESLFSYRLGGTSGRYYGRRSTYARSGPVPDDRDFLDRAEAQEREEREEIQITVERRSETELWQRVRGLRDRGRFDSLEIALDRLLASYPENRKARRWRRNLPQWRQQQERALRSKLNDHLDELEDGIEDQDLEILDLWLASARGPTRSFFRRFFDRFDRTRARYLLKGSEVEDGTLIFDVTLTLEGFQRNQRSIETHPWRGRLQGERFLDPFPS